MGFKFSRFLLWSWVVTLPIVVLGSVATSNTIERFNTFMVRYNASPFKTTLSSFADYEIDTMGKKAKILFMGRENAQSEFPTIELFVPQTELTKLHSHLPQSGLEYVNGTMVNEGESEKIKFRYRGDFAYHWAFDKKSIRVKTKKGKLFHNIRAFNLQAPKFKEQLNNYLGLSLANEMGLMGPRVDLVRVKLNGKASGTHVFVEQLEEMTLRYQRVMPGDLYRGELAGKDNYIGLKGINNNLFEFPGYWDKMAVNNHYPLGSTEPLKELINTLKKSDTVEGQERLLDIMDIDQWGRFSAYESLANTEHYSRTHNWRIYYDPWRQHLVPVVWDPVGWPRGWRTKDPNKSSVRPMISTDLHIALFKNGDFVRAREKVLLDFYQSGQAKEFAEFSDDVAEAYIRESKIDPGLRPVSTKEVTQSVRKLSSYIERVANEGDTLLFPENIPVKYAQLQNGFRLSVGGTNSIKRFKIRSTTPLSVNSAVDISYTSTGVSNSPKTYSISPRLTKSLNRGELIVNASLLPNIKISEPVVGSKRNLLPGVGTYDVILDSTESKIHALWVDMGNGWTKVSKVKSIKPANFRDLYKAATTVNVPDQEVWSGTKVISGVNIIDAPTKIMPGTMIHLETNASLIFKEKLHAVGTAQAPIRFVRAPGSTGPWGTVSLQGTKTSGSRLTHCEMVGGSGYKGPLFNFSGMFSAHDTKDLVVDSCLFKDGSIVDDMVHVVYADLILKNSVFDNSYSDAIDIDISKAVLDNCTFIRSGNDAVDLMSSVASVTNTKFKDSGDKGISVGEGSFLLAVDNEYDNNEIAVQAKDGSKAFLYNQTMLNNRRALDAYKKNWRYNAGGEILLFKSVVKNNESAITNDKNSKIYVFDSYIDQKLKASKRMTLLGVDENTSASSPTLLLPETHKLSDENQELMKAFDPAALKLRDATVRGADSDA